MQKINAFILAAGKGTRLNDGSPSPIPKVLYRIGGRPMISYTVATLKKLGFNKPIVIVGYKAESVKKILGKKVLYVLQKEQWGTGHALYCAKDYLKKVKTALVLGGDDSAFYKPETLQQLITLQRESNSAIALLTLRHPQPAGLGRIIRDHEGKITAIVEEKEATPAQKKIKEINAGAYCFDTKWLLQNLPRLKKHRQTKEYYLTDLVKLALKENKHVTSFQITDPNEWVGVNTLEELRYANFLMKKRQSDHV